MLSRILIIEDNPQSARLAAKFLKTAGHPVEMAETGENGLTSALGNPPDLILLDLGLPDIDGQTVVALLRQQPALTKTQIVAFTAWPEDTAHNMAAAYGCDGVITKPIQKTTFLAAVAGFLAKTSPMN